MAGGVMHTSNEVALKGFSDEARLSALLSAWAKEKATAASQDKTDADLALMVAGMRRLSADLPGLRHLATPEPATLDAAAALERLVDNGEEGAVLLRRLERQQLLRASTEFDMPQRFLVPVAGSKRKRDERRPRREATRAHAETKLATMRARVELESRCGEHEKRDERRPPREATRAHAELEPRWVHDERGERRP